MTPESGGCPAAPFGGEMEPLGSRANAWRRQDSDRSRCAVLWTETGELTMCPHTLWEPGPMRDRDARSSGSSRARAVLDWWLRDPRTGRITLIQWPNPALWVWAVTVVATGLGVLPHRAEEIRWVGAGALIAWAADELLRGASPARRGLGLAVLVFQLHRLLTG